MVRFNSTSSKFVFGNCTGSSLEDLKIQGDEVHLLLTKAGSTLKAAGGIPGKTVERAPALSPLAGEKMHGICCQNVMGLVVSQP